MSEGSVHYSVADKVATIVFDRPEARNAITWAMYYGLAQALESIARKPIRDSLRVIMAKAKSAGLFLGDSDAMTERFLGLLWGDLMIALLLQAVNRPSTGEITRRAREATTALLQLYPELG